MLFLPSDLSARSERLRVFFLVRLEKAHDSAKFLVMLSSPAADAGQRDDKCAPKFGEGILDSNRLRSRRLPRD